MKIETEEKYFNVYDYFLAKFNRGNPGLFCVYIHKGLAVDRVAELILRNSGLNNRRSKQQVFLMYISICMDDPL